MSDLAKSLLFALEKYAAETEVVPIRELLIDSARKNDKRHAYVTLAVPDDVVKGLKGKRDEEDLVLLVRVPKRILERSESRIVLPGEVG